MRLKSQSHGSTRADEAEFPEAYTHANQIAKLILLMKIGSLT